MTGGSNSAKRGRTTGDRVHSAAIRFLRAVRTVDDGARLSAPRLSILSVLAFKGPLSLGSLAEAEQVTPATMTRHIQGLETGGLVSRAKTSKDNRVVTISLSGEGRRQFDAARNARLAALDSAVAALEPEDIAKLDAASAALLALAERLTVKPD
ncbi:MarR family transcriptional regulator [uncultured Maricaulis sp.]|uniref:MarR family winged helix-turn-helix transcriptional regulator n=1 Tax=uncultured Maricaulis sp. TaxID=174710 RepID=UPI0030D89BA1|tara:strand:+ start:8821 stop:9282 length:462 start_codon:yes stop_codon:yes gene_type:complete